MRHKQIDYNNTSVKINSNRNVADTTNDNAAKAAAKPPALLSQ